MRCKKISPLIHTDAGSRSLFDRAAQEPELELLPAEIHLRKHATHRSDAGRDSYRQGDAPLKANGGVAVVCFYGLAT